MRRYINLIVATAVVIVCISCNKKEAIKEGMLEGNATILVDETLTPIVEDQVQIFESRYKAKLKIDARSEAEVIQALVKDSTGIAILSRKLNESETKIFTNRKIIPRSTLFAKDAIALIANDNNKDTLIALKDVIGFIQGKASSGIKGLVFDNPNSSTVRYICELAGLKALPVNGVFSFKTNNEVIEYVAKNQGMIGVVGINYIFEPAASMKQYLENINVLHVKGLLDTSYYNPTQNNIAEGKYPLARDLYIVNCQGSAGLGKGFGVFISSETGQRIILKSGLVPIRFPSRKISTRNQINDDKVN